MCAQVWVTAVVMFKWLVFSVLVAVSSPATAQTNGLPVDGNLLPGWREADGRHMSGLSLQLAPGWKTYWRSPGAGGIPPRFNWSGSQNLGSVQVVYPIPKVMLQYGLRSIGYDQDVVFPLIITAKDQSKPIRLRAEIEIGVCEEVCIPMVMQLSQVLPNGGTHDTAIADSLVRQPERHGAFSCEIEPISDGLRLKAALPSIESEIVVLETREREVWVSAAEIKVTGSRRYAVVDMVPPNGQPFALARDGVRMTLIGNGRAIEMRGCR